MKKLLSYTALIAAGMMVFASCEKQADRTAEYTTVEDKAFIRVIHASPSFRQVFNAPDSINLYVNNAKVNGPLITYGGFPGCRDNRLWLFRSTCRTSNLKTNGGR